MGFYSLVAFFQKGGIFMYPILLVFTIGIAIAFERLVQLTRVRNANQKMWTQINPLLVRGDFDTLENRHSEALTVRTVAIFVDGIVCLIAFCPAVDLCGFDHCRNLFFDTAAGYDHHLRENHE